MAEPKWWLKSLGMGARGGQLPDRWDEIGDGLFRRAATFAKRPSMQPGDGVVFYASGTGRIFAAGEVTSYPYEHDDDTAWSWRVDVKLIASRDLLRHGVPLDALAVDGREHNVRIRRRSHVNLTEKEYNAAVEALRA